MYTLALLGFAASAHALGRAIVTNQCDAPLYLWSVGSHVGPQVTLQKDQSYSEVFHVDPNSTATSIRLSTIEDGLNNPDASQIEFKYSLDTYLDTNVSYGLTSVFGYGFAGRTLGVKPTDSACESIVWPAGKPSGQNQTQKCQSNTDLEFTFCSGHCLPSWFACGNNAPGDTRICCTHCIGSHHCVEAP